MRLGLWWQADDSRLRMKRQGFFAAPARSNFRACSAALREVKSKALKMA